MELEELHILQRDALAEQNRTTIACVRIRIGRDFKDATISTRGKDDSFRMEGMQFARGKFNGNHARGFAFHHNEIKDLIFIEERDLVLDALLIERLQDHMTCAIRRMCRAADWLARDIIRMPAKRTL